MPADITHKSFPQPDNANAAVWRYLPFHRFKGLIESGRLYVPSAASLGDELEGSMPRGEVDLWEQRIAAAQTRESRNVLLHNRNFWQRALTSWRDSSFVSCWNLGRHESYTMWRAYAPVPESVVVRSTYAKLRDVFPNQVNLGRVSYIDYQRDRITSDSNFLNYIMHKDVFYRHEDEVRAVLNAFLPSSEGGVDEADLFQDAETEAKSYRPQVDFVSLIDAVVLHPDASKPFAKEASAFCEEHGLPRPIGSRALLRPIY